MKRSIQYDLLEIQQFDVSQWLFPVHTHNHFELIIIRKGTGHHIINGNRFAYQAGDVFFLGPPDSHNFVVDEKTAFYTLSFTELYMARLAGVGTNFWQKIKEQSLTRCSSLVGSIFTDPTAQRSLKALIDVILAEQSAHGHPFSNPVVDSLMKAILSLVDRQLAKLPQDLNSTTIMASSLMQRIGAYVCQYITEPDCLRIEKMADVFHYSQSHLGALFKQQAGESIQQYIIRYRLQLVETRLRLSTMTISQIADEFGFTDICHLNKLFKQHYQTTPTSYRRSLVVPNLVNRPYVQNSFN